MAGAYLTIGAKYRPFSYDELIRPVAMATEMHNKIDEQYAALQEKAGVWENLANKETDPESYKKYKDYSDSLKAQAEDLAKNGLNPQSMRDMLNLRARYSSDIIPLEQAYTRRRQLADEQRKMIMQNPTLKFERDMNTTSLDDFVKNPELDYGYSVNGAMIAKQAGEAFSHLAKSIQEEPQYKHILNGYYYQSKVRAGYNPVEILMLANNDPAAPKELRAISQQVYDSTGVEDYIKRAYPNADTNEGDALQAQEWRDYVNSYINQGAWNAVGTTQYGTVANPQKAYENQLNLARLKAGLKGNGAGSASINRNDRHLIGISDKNNKRYLGSFDTAGDTHATQRIVDSIRIQYGGGKNINIIEGLDEKSGGYKTGTMKVTDFNELIKNKDIDFTNLQVDYGTGNLIAIATVKDGKNNSNTVRIMIPYSNALNEADSAAIKESVSKLNEVELAKLGKSDLLTYFSKDGVWYLSNGKSVFNANGYEEDLKNKIYLAASGMLNYFGAVNQSTEAGQKLNSAMNPYGALTSGEDLDINYEKD